MVPKQLEEWLRTQESQAVGWSEDGGESVGHRSGRRIVEIKRKRKEELTAEDYDHMVKVINYIKRHTAQGPDQKADVEGSRWRFSLMNWGFDPLKKLTRSARVSGKSASDYEAKYTRPKLRERLKDDLKQSSKGGRKGQWSARKSQLLAQRYEAEGGDYKGAKTASQHSLEEWTAQKWQTVEGDVSAETGLETHRYLPEKVWAPPSDAEGQRADETKVKAGTRGASSSPSCGRNQWSGR